MKTTVKFDIYTRLMYSGTVCAAVLENRDTNRSQVPVYKFNNFRFSLIIIIGLWHTQLSSEHRGP